MRNELMRRAIELSIENVNTLRGGPFGALIVRGGAILAEGTNLVTSSLDPTAHAEIIAIRSACKVLQTFQLSGCEIYCSCEPCPMCLGAIYWARPDRVYYAGTREDAAAAGFDDALIYAELGDAASCTPHSYARHNAIRSAGRLRRVAESGRSNSVLKSFDFI